MKPFADLLRISHSAPGEVIAHHERRVEGELLVEDVVWKAPDDQRVPAYVIRPTKARGPLPAVICLHGTGGSRESVCTEEFGVGPWTSHSSANAHTTLLGWGRELARRGYLALALTQRGLDVRTPDTNDQAKDLLVRGRTLMGAIVYEIRQAITYLEQREDVDPDGIGITGISFGGITSFYTWLVDHRIAAAAPVCGGVGSVDVLLRQGVPSYHGFYWWIPGMLLEGDHGEYAAAMAPRPLMLWAPLQDIGMPAAGVERFLATAAPAYCAAGDGDALQVHRPEGEHAFTPEAFEAVARFLDRYLQRR